TGREAQMRELTRRSVLRGSAGLFAAVAIARPHIANAQAKTAQVWWTQGFVPDEDTAFLKLVADYEKASGNKIDHSILPFAPLREEALAAIPGGVVPEIREDAVREFGGLQSGQATLLVLRDVVHPKKSHNSKIALIPRHYYNGVTKERGYYGLPMKVFATPFH